MASVFGLNLPLLLLLAGSGLLIAEALAPGAYFIVLGIALLVAGLVGLALPSSLGVFAVVIMAGLVVGVGAVTLYAYRQFDFYGGKGQGQTSDSDSLKGKTGRVTERVTDTDGQVKLDSGGFNPHYQARAFDDDIAVGQEVIVVDPGGGNVLTVESMAVLGTDEIDDELEAGQTDTTDESDSVETATDTGDRDTETDLA
ncbi:MAG: NfeD family protein [Halorhabdus sp.]